MDMPHVLNGCMCQMGECESCNAVVEAFEAMREALRWMAENALNMVAHPDLYSAIHHHVKEARAALALADAVSKVSR